MNENNLRTYIRRMLTEQPTDEPKNKKPEKPKEPKKKKADTQPGEIGVTAGRGSWSKSVKEAGALAEEAPDELMQNLGIKAAGTVQAVLKQALANSDVMKKSYASMSNVTAGQMSGIIITMGELDSRNGAKYLHHTLIGAKNSGKLSLEDALQIDRLDTSSVVVYKSSKRNSWPKATKGEK